MRQERKPKKKTEAEIEKENDNTEEAVDAEFEAKYDQNDAHQEKGGILRNLHIQFIN